MGALGREPDEGKGTVVLRPLVRLAGVVLGGIALTGLAPATAGAFSGAYVPDATYSVTYAAAQVLPRVVCPAKTQSTPRPGDFSFCTGTIVVTKSGREVGRAPFSVRTFDSHVIKVPVRRSMRRFFPPRRQVRVHWKATSHDGQGQIATRDGDITMLNTFKR
jgi:hypothetical protein